MIKLRYILSVFLVFNFLSSAIPSNEDGGSSMNSLSVQAVRSDDEYTRLNELDLENAQSNEENKAISKRLRCMRGSAITASLLLSATLLFLGVRNFVNSMNCGDCVTDLVFSPPEKCAPQNVIDLVPTFFNTDDTCKLDVYLRCKEGNGTRIVRDQLRCVSGDCKWQCQNYYPFLKDNSGCLNLGFTFSGANNTRMSPKQMRRQNVVTNRANRGRRNNSR